MQIWHYHPDTHQLVGTSEATPDPLELLNAQRAAYSAIATPAREAFAEAIQGGEDEGRATETLDAQLGRANAAAAAVAPEIWLIPAHATDIAPPDAPDGQVAVFGDGAWSLVPIDAPAE